MTNFLKIIICFFCFISIPMLMGNEDIAETTCVCGNGIQEVLPQSVAACPYRLYGTAISGPTSPTTLFYFNTYDGTAYTIGTVSSSPSITGITAMDFSPQGVLYAVGKVGSNFALATINCQTAQASIVGTFSLPSGAGITGINFDAQGKLYAHQTAQTSSIRQDGVLGTINIATGTYTPIGSTFVADIGNGIAFAPFPNGQLYHAGSNSLNVLDTATAQNTSLFSLLFFPPTNSNPRINDLDFDPITNTMYAAINDKAPGSGSPNENYLGVIDINDGQTSYVKLPAREAPGGLSAIAVNRPYETCDQGMPPLTVGSFDEIPLPTGASCSVSCQLTESDCSDGLDNDFDGIFDCQDSDCEDLSCNATSCTADTCSAGSCVTGLPLDCDDFNECTSDSCNLGVCLNEITEGSACNNDFNPCTIDTCDVLGFCQVVENQLNGTVCDDENFCTEDDVCTEGFCGGSPLTDGTPCDDGTTCTDPDTCQGGGCIGERVLEICDNLVDDNCDGCIDGEGCEEGQDPECAEATAQEGECYDGVDNDVDGLTDCEDNDCNGMPCADEGNPCTDGFCQFLNCNHVPNDANACSDENPCTDDACNAGSCLGSPNDTYPCDDGNLCTENDMCTSGSCLGGTEKFCDDENPCTEDFCAEGDCSFEPLTGTACLADDNDCTDDVCDNGVCTHPNDNSNVCSDELSCTNSDQCTSGSCVGTPGVETCYNGLDDDCDFLIDFEDPNCSSQWLRVFVTKSTYNPNFGGATQADTICQQAATAASRSGTFKAFISSDSSNAASRILNPYNRPWYLYTSTAARIADDKADLLDGKILEAISADEFGADIKSPKFAWTGSKDDGTVNTNNTCNNWTTTQSKIKGTRGATDKIDYKWVNQPDATCNQKYRLYCFQIDTTP